MNFKNLYICLAIGTILSSPFSPVFSQNMMIYRWQNKSGNLYFSATLEEIPLEFRDQATQGMFVPVEPLTSPVSTPPEKQLSNESIGPDSQALLIPPPSELFSSTVKNELTVISEDFKEEGGYIYIQGKIKNNYPSSVHYIKVKVLFHNQNDEILSQKTLFVNPLELNPGDIGSYHIVLKADPQVVSFSRELSWK